MITSSLSHGFSPSVQHTTQCVCPAKKAHLLLTMDGLLAPLREGQSKLFSLCNFFTCRVSMHWCCLVRPWLIEFSGVVLELFHDFSLSRSAFFFFFPPPPPPPPPPPDVSLIKSQDWFKPFLRQLILYSVSWIRKLFNKCLILCLLCLKICSKKRFSADFVSKYARTTMRDSNTWKVKKNGRFSIWHHTTCEFSG